MTITLYPGVGRYSYVVFRRSSFYPIADSSGRCKSLPVVGSIRLCVEERRGARSLEYDLTTGQGVVSSRAVLHCDLLRRAASLTQKGPRRFVSFRINEVVSSSPTCTCKGEPAKSDRVRNSYPHHGVIDMPSVISSGYLCQPAAKAAERPATLCNQEIDAVCQVLAN
jgi:hypothetical protein